MLGTRRITRNRIPADREDVKPARRNWYPGKKEHFSNMRAIGGTKYRIETEIAFNDHLKAIREQMLKNRIDREEIVPVDKEETITIENK